MESAQTSNAALITVRAFHYQTMVGIEKCFDLQEGEAIWFERDGDISIVSDSADVSAQYEVKNYGDVLTDHHGNFWKTLKNWLASEFNHENYAALILHTTQRYGATTQLVSWNSLNSDQRLNLLEGIFATRTREELEAESKKMKPIVKLQKEVMGTDSDLLKAVLGKVVLITEVDNLEATERKILSRLVGIPKNNKKSFLQGIVGFVYSDANPSQWTISEKEFRDECEALTMVYCKKHFTLPPFTGREATTEELVSFGNSDFVKKIQDIEYYTVLPDAVGNWIELHNSLSAELDGAPQYYEATKSYQDQIVKRFKSKHSSKKRNSKAPLYDAKDLYDDVIGETPPSTELISSPPLEYKNGLIHDAMDDEDLKIQWSVEP